MYDPKFEKAIQQKMEELEFRPAESVWVNIEKSVVVKRRRRAGYFWRFLLPGVVLLGFTGAYVFYHHDQAGALSVHTPAPAPASVPVSGEMGKSSAAVGKPGISEPGAGAAVSREPGINAAGTASFRRNSHTPAGGRAITAFVGKGRAMNAGGSLVDPNETSEIAPNAMGATGQNQAATNENQVAEGQNQVAEWFYLPDLADQKLGAQVQGSALRTKKTNLVSLTKLSHPRSRWEAGFVAGGGWSKLNRLNADRAKYALAANATSFYAIASSSSSKQYISHTSPGVSFDGGIYLQKALSDRWIFNTGMNLHYYSNHISIGQQVSTNVPASASLFLPTAATAVAQTTASTMYSAGNAQHFTNQYYFLELPVGLQWKVTKSHILPIFLEGGISLSRLMGASALFYDAKTGLYSKNAMVVDKTQFNISSALMVGLPIHGLGIELGPQVQYGLTPLVNTQGLGDQHLFYAGLRVIVIPGRK